MHQNGNLIRGGWTTLVGSSNGATVTASDLTPELFDAGRAIAPRSRSKIAPWQSRPAYFSPGHS